MNFQNLFLVFSGALVIGSHSVGVAASNAGADVAKEPGHAYVQVEYANTLQCVRRAMSVATGTPKPLPLNETHRSIVVKALQAFHRDRITMSNCQAVYALENGQEVLPLDVFGVV